MMETKMGSAFLLKIGDGDKPPTYKTIAGLRVSAMSINEGAVSVNASGIFLGSSAEAAIRAHALAGTVEDYELSFEDGVRLRGRFLVMRLDYAGDFNGERNYTLQLESSGKVETDQ